MATPSCALALSLGRIVALACPALALSDDDRAALSDWQRAEDRAAAFAQRADATPLTVAMVRETLREQALAATRLRSFRRVRKIVDSMDPALCRAVAHG